jgi:hypothetical protein
VLPRDIPIGQLNRVSFFPTDGDFFLGQRDDGRVSLIVLDDQFEQSTSVAFNRLLSKICIMPRH